MNNRRVADAEERLCAADLLDGRLVVLRKGKRQVRGLRIQRDQP